MQYIHPKSKAKLQNWIVPGPLEVLDSGADTWRAKPWFRQRNRGEMVGSLTSNDLLKHAKRLPSHFAFSHNVGSTTGLEFPDNRIFKRNESFSWGATLHASRFMTPPMAPPDIIPWSNYTPRKKKNMTLENPYFSIGNTSSNGGFSNCHVSFHGG